MKQHEDYAKGGPSYKDQMYDGYINYYSPEDPNYTEQFPEIWDNCMMLCEHVHNERIRNIVGPIYNLLEILRHAQKETDPDGKLYYLAMIEKYNWLADCDKSIDRLLNITEQ